MTASDTNQTSLITTTEFPSKISNRKKISNEHFNLCEAEISLDEIIKFINSKTNNESPDSVGLTAEFYKQFSNELAPALLDVYDSWGKLGTMGVTSRTRIIMIFYIKKVIKKILQNYRSILTLTIKFILLILKNLMQKWLNNIIGEQKSEAIKNRIILHSFYYLWHNWCVK